MDANQLNAMMPPALETTKIRPALYAPTTMEMETLSVPPAAAAPSGAPPGLATAPTMAALARAFRRRWLIAIAAGMAAAAATIATVFFVMPPKFTTEVRLLVRQ